MVGAISRRANKLAQSLLAFALSAALIAEPAMAQAQDNPAAPTAPATDAEANPAEPAAGESFSRDELEKLLAPIALYPDPLLAQMLPASAYPVQIVQAQRWLDKNKALVAKNDLFRNRQPELGSSGEGARTLSGRYQADERRPRLDDRPRRRRSEPAPGRR